jgi:hypothetical protein
MFFGRKHRYGIGISMSATFDIQTARVRCQGRYLPPPVTRPPPGKPYFLVYWVTCAPV